MAALCDVRSDAWLDDPDAVRAEFEALIAANFDADLPESRPGPTPPSGRGGPPRTRRRTLRTPPTSSAPVGLEVARERSPPLAG